MRRMISLYYGKFKNFGSEGYGLRDEMIIDINRNILIDNSCSTTLIEHVITVVVMKHLIALACLKLCFGIIYILILIFSSERIKKTN